ncbi:uncharacterized protein LOC142349523 [Convolutriloba macropyga]|uniref:uncharacterized protein LOC142349523 n=1 Tax=Convolutriloba macropyga TaxID=536237 RepID=UPI003F5239A6
MTYPCECGNDGFYRMAAMQSEEERRALTLQYEAMLRNQQAMQDQRQLQPDLQWHVNSWDPQTQQNFYDFYTAEMRQKDMIALRNLDANRYQQERFDRAMQIRPDCALMAEYQRIIAEMNNRSQQEKDTMEREKLSSDQMCLRNQLQDECHKNESKMNWQLLESMARLHNERERQEKESQERAADLLRLKVRETFYSACDCLEKEDTDTTDRGTQTPRGNKSGSEGGRCLCKQSAQTTSDLGTITVKICNCCGSPTDRGTISAGMNSISSGSNNCYCQLQQHQQQSQQLQHYQQQQQQQQQPMPIVICLPSNQTAAPAAEPNKSCCNCKPNNNNSSNTPEPPKGQQYASTCYCKQSERIATGNNAGKCLCSGNQPTSDSEGRCYCSSNIHGSSSGDGRCLCSSNNTEGM